MKKIFKKLKNIFKRHNKKGNLPIQSQVIPNEKPKPNSKPIIKTIEDYIKPIIITEQSVAEELRIITSQSLEKENSKNKEDYNDLLKKI